MKRDRTIRLVTFDLDGTMLDDEWAHAEANRRISERLGLDDTLLGKMTGYPVRLRWRELCRAAGVEADIESLAQEHFRITAELVEEAGVPAAPGLMATMQALKEQGYIVAVVSSSDGPFVKAMTDRLGVSAYIDHFVSQEQVEELKPAPDIYWKAQGLAGVRPEQSIGIEDSEPGCLALRRAGMYTIGFRDEGRNQQVLEDVDTWIDRMEELFPILERLQGRDLVSTP